MVVIRPRARPDAGLLEDLVAGGVAGHDELAVGRRAIDRLLVDVDDDELDRGVLELPRDRAAHAAVAAQDEMPTQARYCIRHALLLPSAADRLGNE